MATINEQCDRLTALTGELEAILSAAPDRPLSEDETARYDGLAAEGDTLRAAIDQARTEEAERQKRAAKLAEFKQGLTLPRPRGFTLDDPARVSDPGKPKINIKPYQGTLRAFESAEDAYLAGMHTIAVMHSLSPSGIGEAGDWASRFCRDKGVSVLTAIQYEGENTRGGYLVFPTMEAAIVKLREQYGVARQQFAVKQMASEVHSWPREQGSHTVYYPDEGGEITASAMKWEQLTLTAKKAAALARFSRELSEDAVVGIAEELADNMAWKFSYAEDLNGFIGDGTSTYAGMTGIVTKIGAASGATYAGSIVAAIAGNTTFGTLDLTDFESCIGQLPMYAERNAKWYISKAGWAASMMRLLDAAGGNTSSILAGQAAPSFLGYPVVFVQVMNSTLTAQLSTIICLLGDLRQCCYLGNRRGFTLDTSSDRYFELDQIAVKATERFAITCTPGDSAAPTTAAGPVIALKTPGA